MEIFIKEKYIITDAIILKYQISGEVNRFFSFISPEYGIQSATAFGAEKLKSRFCSTIQPFVILKLYLDKNPKNSYLKLYDISSIDTNDFLKSNLNYIYLSSFFADVLLNSFISNEEYKNYYFLLKYSLEILKEKNDIKKSFLFFTNKFLFLSGYNLFLTNCKKCSNYDDFYYFDEKKGGIFCQNCSILKNNKIMKESAILWNDFLEKKYIILKDYDIKQNYFIELYQLIINLLTNVFGKELKTFQLLNLLFNKKISGN